MDQGGSQNISGESCSNILNSSYFCTLLFVQSTCSADMPLCIYAAVQNMIHYAEPYLIFPHLNSLASSLMMTETEDGTLSSYHKHITILLQSGDYSRALQVCEEVELLTSSSGGKDDSHWLKVQMALYYITDDVNNARHLWRRLPMSAKTQGGEVAVLWEVGKCLWVRDMEGAHAQLRGVNWGHEIDPIISLVRRHLVDRQLGLIRGAYSTVPLKRVAAMLGYTTSEAEHECVSRGWTVNIRGEEQVVKPQQERVGQDVQTTPQHLQAMARHITFLEQRSLSSSTQ
ncbi:unnamed protein product [Choristocarpus tenellus]